MVVREITSWGCTGPHSSWGWVRVGVRVGLGMGWGWVGVGVEVGVEVGFRFGSNQMKVGGIYNPFAHWLVGWLAGLERK